MGPIHTADGLRARRELRVGRKRSISEEISPDVDISGVMLFLVLLTAGKSGKTKQTVGQCPFATWFYGKKLRQFLSRIKQSSS